MQRMKLFCPLHYFLLYKGKTFPHEKTIITDKIFRHRLQKLYFVSKSGKTRHIYASILTLVPLNCTIAVVSYGQDIAR